MSKLIKIFFFIFIIVVLSLKGFTQHRMLVPVNHFNVTQRAVRQNNLQPNAGRKIQVVKEGFINKQLNLTSKESKEFWPLYRKYSQELTAVRILKRINNSNSTSDGAEQVDKDLEYETKLVDIKKRYKDEFYKILPPEKLSILYKSEREFNDEVLKQLSERSVRAGD